MLPKPLRLVLCCSAIIAGCVFAQEGIRKVTRVEAMAAAISKVQPEYPPMARQLNLEGIVELEALVTETGAVEKVNIVSGNPVLTRGSADALKRWKFAPFTTNGKVVKVLAPVTFNFKR